MLGGLIQTGVTDEALAAKYVVQQDPVTGILKVADVPIAAGLSMTWAQIQAIPKIAANDQLTVICTDVGVGGSTWRYSHAKLRWYVYGHCYLYSSMADVTHGATLTTVESMASFQLQNGGVQSPWHDGDVILVEYTIWKTGTADALRTTVNVHTATGTGGTAIKPGHAAPSGTAVTYKDTFKLKRLSATSIQNLQVPTAVAGDASSGTATAVGPVTVGNLDTATTWINSNFYCSASTGDTNVILKDIAFELLTRGG